MGSLLPGWNASAEAPTPKRRWSDTVRRQDLETLRREEQRHREARARLSAAAAAAVDAAAGRAGAARASFPGPRFAGESTFASRRREEAAESGATEDLLREMRLGAWHRLLSDARRSLEPDPGDGELSVDSSVVSGVAATLADPTRDFFPGADSATFGTPRRDARARCARAEQSGGRFPRGQSRGDAETATETETETKERKTPRVRVRLEVVNDDDDDDDDDDDGGKKSTDPDAGELCDCESFVRVVERRPRGAAAAAAAAAPARPSGWWDRTESAHLNRDGSREI